MVFKCELAVKLHAKDVDVGTSLDRYPRQDHVMIRVHSPRAAKLTAKALVLLGFSIMHQ